MVYKQGEFNGFCGIFSIINSVDKLFKIEYDDLEKLFCFLITEADDPLTVVVAGSFFPQVQKWLHLTVEWLEENDYGKLTWKQPFMRKKHETPDEWCEDVRNQLVDGAAIIIGMIHPYNHWSSIDRVTQTTVVFSDSDSLTHLPRHAIYFKKFEGITDEQMVVCPHQVFSLKGQPKQKEKENEYEIHNCSTP